MCERNLTNWKNPSKIQNAVNKQTGKIEVNEKTCETAENKQV